MKFNSYVILFLILIFSSNSYSGNTGSISGKLIDKNSRQELPGAVITILDTKLWTVADKYGCYFISNIAPGTYEIRVKMLGYATIVMRDVSIRADYINEINFEMVPEAIEGPEIIIIAEKPLITKDSPSTSQAFNFSDVNRKLPIDHFDQALQTQSSAFDGHIHGGRKYNASYIVDGHSIQDPMFREIGTLVPLSAISDINILSGGFNAEYGQAMSGVVNLSTKEGKEKTEGFFKIYTDNFGLKVKNDNLRRIEMSLGGPLLLSFGGPMYDLNYYISGTTNFDNMQFSNNKNQDNPVVPKDHDYHYTSKLSFRLWNKIKIVFQSLASSWQLYNSEDQSLITEAEKYSVDQKKIGNRLNMTVIHTLNPQSFYTFSLGRDIFKKQLYNQITMSQEAIVNLEPQLQPKQYTYDWEDLFNERVYFLNASYYRQFASSNMIQFGTQLNFYNIYLNNLASDLEDTNSLDVGSFQDSYMDKLDVKPYTIAFFGQNRIEYGHIVINMGMRFDYFNPSVNFPEKSIISSSDTLALASQQGKSHFQISPRCELSFPFLLKNDRLYLNYGWFFQTPPLYYFYLNSQQNFNVSHPLLGNPQLDPEKTEAFEIGYQKSIGSKSILGTTFFVKKVTNLVNTQNYYSEENPSTNYTQFKNLDRASIKGVEIFVEKRPGNNNFSGKFSYTYCKATGTGSFPLQNYYSLLQNSFSNPTVTQYPLALDQRHKLSLNISYLKPKKIEINLLAQLNSPLPILDDTFRMVGRGNWRKYIDLRIIKPLNVFKGEFSPYFEILNILNDKDHDRIYNPYYFSNNTYYMAGLDNYLYEYGRRIRVGLMISFN